MGVLIDALLNLSRVARSQTQRETGNLGDLATKVAKELRAETKERSVSMVITLGLQVAADPRLLRIVLENLIGNAWKFTAKNASAQIEIGAVVANGQMIFFVTDNGTGFDMNYAQKHFGPFQRLHGINEFDGTGIGLLPSSVLSTATAEACGPKAKWVKARRSISRFESTRTDAATASGHFDFFR